MQDNIRQLNSPIKVCFVCPKAYPLFNTEVKRVFGGAEVDLYLLATELAKDNRYEVSFIVADYGQAAEEQRENVRILKSINFQRNPLVGIGAIWKTLKLADSDIYMFETASFGVPLVSLFCRVHKKRFVYRTAHVQECNGDYSKRHRIAGVMFARSLKKANLIFCQNQSDQAALRKSLGVESVVAPNAYRNDLVGNVEKKTILWVGRSAWFKHPERFLELAKAYPNEQFVMICQRATDDSDYKALCQKARDIKHLRFYERVDFFEIDRFFAEAKVFVSTSDSEGYPNTFIQACKAETAILSYIVNPDNFIEITNCGICCNGNMGQMIRGLDTLLNENRYLNMGNRAKTYVQQKHGISSVIGLYKHEFEKWIQNENH